MSQCYQIDSQTSCVQHPTKELLVDLCYVSHLLFDMFSGAQYLLARKHEEYDKHGNLQVISSESEVDIMDGSINFCSESL